MLHNFLKVSSRSCCLCNEYCILLFTAGCGNTLFTGSHGYVTSPSYPSEYGDNQNCTNIIYAEQPSHFYLRFIFFDVPSCGTCECDWVEVNNNLI